MTDDQSTYLCNDDDLNSLTDYFTAALAGEESKSRLQQMWEQEIGIIKATRQDKKKQSMSDRYKDEEPDLTPISNCIKKEPIVITPKICTLFWNYRADSGHLYHLLFDLVGEEFVTSHELMDSIMKVLDGWQTPEEKQKHDTAIRNAVLDELGILYGEDAKRFNEQLDHPEPLTPEARDLVMQAKEIAKATRKEKGCPYWNPDVNIYPDEPENHCTCQFSNIRKDEREKVLNAVRDACAEKMSDKNPSVSGVMLSYILADLRTAIAPTKEFTHGP